MRREREKRDGKGKSEGGERDRKGGREKEREGWMTEALEIDKGRWKESRNKRERDNQKKNIQKQGRTKRQQQREKLGSKKAKTK